MATRIIVNSVYASRLLKYSTQREVSTLWLIALTVKHRGDLFLINGSKAYVLLQNLLASTKQCVSNIGKCISIIFTYRNVKKYSNKYVIQLNSTQERRKEAVYPTFSIYLQLLNVLQWIDSCMDSCLNYPPFWLVNATSTPRGVLGKGNMQPRSGRGSNL